MDDPRNYLNDDDFVIEDSDEEYDIDDIDADDDYVVVDNGLDMVKQILESEKAACGDAPCSSKSLQPIVETAEDDEDDEVAPLDFSAGEEPIEVGYNLISSAEVMCNISRVSMEVAGITNLTPGNCRVFLRKFDWDREKFISKYMEYEELDVFAADHLVRIDSTPYFSELAYEGECDICYDTSTLRSLVCGHVACEDCWRAHFKSRLEEGVLDIICMEPECGYILNDEMIELVLSEDEDLKEKLANLMINNYVQLNRSYKWCAGNNCDRIVQSTHLRPQAIFCVCGHSQCSACNKDCHLPLPCDFIEKEPDTASHKWVADHARPCPKCKAPIEKNGGCNFMQCNSPGCKIPFCWSCMQELHANHAPHNCHIYVPSGEKSKEVLDAERYEHYINRFKMHEQSREKEQNIIHRIKYIKEKLLSRCEISQLELRIFDQAALSLNRSRTVAMYTNAFAFYMTGDSQRKMLEDNQKDMETFTEELSSLLENDLEGLLSDASGYRSLAKKLREKCEYLDNRRDKLLLHSDECFREKIFEV